MIILFLQGRTGVVVAWEFDTLGELGWSSMAHTFRLVQLAHWVKTV